MMTTRNLVPLLIFAAYHFFSFFEKKNNFFVFESQKRPNFFEFFSDFEDQWWSWFLWRVGKMTSSVKYWNWKVSFLASHFRGEYFVGILTHRIWSHRKTNSSNYKSSTSFQPTIGARLTIRTWGPMASGLIKFGWSWTVI